LFVVSISSFVPAKQTAGKSRGSIRDFSFVRQKE